MQQQLGRLGVFFVLGMMMMASLVGCIMPGPPYTIDDELRMLVNTSKSINVVANDDDNYSDELEISIVVFPQHGQLEIKSINDIVYTPNTDYVGTDSFSYRLINEEGSNEADVAITIKESNLAPVLMDEELTEVLTPHSVYVDLALNDYDADDETSVLTYKIDEMSHQGWASLSGSNLTYTPYEDATEMDYITYSVSDGIDFRVAHVIIHLLDRPILTEDIVYVDPDEIITFDPTYNDILAGGYQIVSIQPVDEVIYRSFDPKEGSKVALESTYSVSFSDTSVTFNASVAGQYYVQYTAINEEDLEAREEKNIQFIVGDDSEYQAMVRQDAFNRTVIALTGLHGRLLLMQLIIGGVILGLYYLDRKNMKRK